MTRIGQSLINGIQDVWTTKDLEAPDRFQVHSVWSTQASLGMSMSYWGSYARIYVSFRELDSKKDNASKRLLRILSKTAEPWELLQWSMSTKLSERLESKTVRDLINKLLTEKGATQ
jgi:hypothetical protein